MNEKIQPGQSEADDRPFHSFLEGPSIADVIAGVSVALVLIPQSIAYATIANLPAEVGLFAATLPLIIAAPFLSCPWLQTGPTALTSLLAGGALFASGFNSESPEELMAAAALMAVIVGVTRFTLGTFGLGNFTRLLQPPIVLGFTTAAAILIICSQVPKVLGNTSLELVSNVRQGAVLHQAFASLTAGGWSVYAIGMATFAGVIAYGGRKIHRLFPSVLLAVLLSMLLAAVIGYSGDTVQNLPGQYPFPSFNFPWDKIWSLLVPSIVIAFVGFAEPASISMTLMGEENLEWDPNQELRAGGMANFISGVMGGYPVGGSFSRTSVNKFAGATSSWSGLITGVAVFALLGLTPFLSSLPLSALGAIIIVAVIRLIKIVEIYKLFSAATISRFFKNRDVRILFSDGIRPGILAVFTL
ncbi:MAG: SulP family inorganic anion transporter, partial [Planctomycetota bacterium]